MLVRYIGVVKSKDLIKKKNITLLYVYTTPIILFYLAIFTYTPFSIFVLYYSLHEIGTYDLPASFDYILMKTNASQLHYIGYSMGTTVFFIMASTRPEYQSKIRSQISLAPVAYFTHIRSPIKYIAPYAKMINVSIGYCIFLYFSMIREKY